MTIVRWSPFPDIEAIDRRFRRMFDGFGIAPAALPAADIYETDAEYAFELEVPGFEEKELLGRGERSHACRHGRAIREEGREGQPVPSPRASRDDLRAPLHASARGGYDEDRRRVHQGRTLRFTHERWTSRSSAMSRSRPRSTAASAEEAEATPRSGLCLFRPCPGRKALSSASTAARIESSVSGASGCVPPGGALFLRRAARRGERSLTDRESVVARITVPWSRVKLCSAHEGG